MYSKAKWQGFPFITHPFRLAGPPETTIYIILESRGSQEVPTVCRGPMGELQCWPRHRQVSPGTSAHSVTVLFEPRQAV